LALSKAERKVIKTYGPVSVHSGGLVKGGGGLFNSYGQPSIERWVEIAAFEL